MRAPDRADHPWLLPADRSHLELGAGHSLAPDRLQSGSKHLRRVSGEHGCGDARGETHFVLSGHQGRHVVAACVRKELLGEDGRGGCSVMDVAVRQRRRRVVAARPLRSSARLSLGRSLSAQCSAGGVSHQPRTERSHARPIKLSGAAICRGSAAISPMTLCGKRPTRCRPAASSMAATRSSSSRVERWEGRQASCFTCSRW